MERTREQVQQSMEDQAKVWGGSALMNSFCGVYEHGSIRTDGQLLEQYYLAPYRHRSQSGSGPS